MVSLALVMVAWFGIYTCTCVGGECARPATSTTVGYTPTDTILEECKALWGSPDRVATLQI